ncbi:MAG: hypothetical protein CVU88_08005 [Firmicutes bacterium HGW-Firmicutes-13]|nr:MAG: hypothetical protein CVU88_08005 [Firmicutes bacterium HGW-Firmicutes-13]
MYFNHMVIICNCKIIKRPERYSNLLDLPGLIIKIFNYHRMLQVKINSGAVIFFLLFVTLLIILHVKKISFYNLSI